VFRDLRVWDRSPDGAKQVASTWIFDRSVAMVEAAPRRRPRGRPIAPSRPLDQVAIRHVAL
jgi:hypothetical protein